jgi:alpha-L-fucosidase
VVPSSKAANGSLILELSEGVVSAEVFAWVFKIDFLGGTK